MSVLTAKQRKALPKSDFTFPGKAPASGSYPVNDPNHARAALSMVARFGSPAQKVAVRAKVNRKFPSIGKKRRFKMAER